jgi:hypothetical protein
MRKIVIVLYVSLLFLFLTGLRTGAVASEIAGFEWTPQGPGQKVVKVITETETAVKFKVNIKGEAVKFRFSIPKKFTDFGIRVKNDVVESKKSIAESSVVFYVPRGLPLGRHDLIIIIIDATDNMEIGRVAIPFLLLPQGIECMC